MLAVDWTARLGAESLEYAVHRPFDFATMLLCLLLVAGCGGTQPQRLLDRVGADPASIAATHRIYTVTTRERSQDPLQVFSGERGDLAFLRVDVSIPRDRATGTIQHPTDEGRRNPALHFAAGEVALYPEKAGFEHTMRERLRETGGRALLFIHGYRTPFDASVYRAAQVVHDSGYTGTPFLFSWASSGRTLDYIYDNNSATIARDRLEEMLRMLRANGATRIDIIAHSMGNWLAVDALRQIIIGGDNATIAALGDVVLASPDIDIDVFRSQLERIGTLKHSIIVLVSRDDRALQVSSLIAGNRPRVGDYANDADLARLGITVVDLSSLDSGDRLNHGRFADNPVIVQLLGERFNEGDAFGQSGDQIAHRVQQLTRGIGQTLGSAAAIVITTPLEVISIAVSP